MTERGLESYISCNPANINMERTIETFENSQGYVKYSIESVVNSATNRCEGKSQIFLSRTPTSLNY
jgi:hypothetical protein